MEEDDVDIVEVLDSENYKNEVVRFYARYEYCSSVDEFLENEEMVRRNTLAMREAYKDMNI